MGKVDESLQMFEQARAAAPDNGWNSPTRSAISSWFAAAWMNRSRTLESQASGCRPSGSCATPRRRLRAPGRPDRAAEEYPRGGRERRTPDGKAAASLARLEPIVGSVVASGSGTSDQEVSN